MSCTAPSSRDPAPCSGLGDSGFRVSEFRIPNSEFRMAYGGSGIPHHENGDRGGAHERHIRGSWTGVTGSDMGCRTLRCYVNSGVGHWVSDGVPGHQVLNPGGGTSDKGNKRPVTSDQTRKEERAGGVSVLSGQRKSP